MTRCYVCNAIIEVPAYDKPAPAITSVMTTLDLPTRVFVCDGCGHAQSSALPDIEAFYDTGYRISLDSEAHDQVIAARPDGTMIYRTDHQADIALRLMNLSQGASLLDYGAAKADTLRKLCATRVDIDAHVFDVSADYAAAWQGWITPDNQAIYTCPPHWKGRFDAVMSHFVIEHVVDPVGFISGIAELLKPGGVLLLSMPDAFSNPGDMIVADHVNHFSPPSLERALNEAGFVLASLDSTSFPGAHFALATLAIANGKPELTDIEDAALQARKICREWQATSASVEAAIRRLDGRKVTIYGAGFYGSWLFHLLSRHGAPLAFLDRNPHLQGGTHMEVPVLSPEDMPLETEVLFVGLNPLKAKAIVAGQPWLLRSKPVIVWLDGA